MMCVERKTQRKNSEFQMGIEPTTFQTLVMSRSFVG